MKYLFTSHKCKSERRGETLLARNPLEARFVLFYSNRFPGVTIGVKVAGRDNEFGWCAAVWTLLVHVGKRKIIRDGLLPAPVPNAL